MGLPDEQQRLVLNALRGAAGKPVSFAELREAGVEFPATIVSELELAGVAIERCRGTSGASVRLVEAAPPPVAPPLAPPLAGPARAAAPAPTNRAPSAPDDEWTMVRRYRASSRDGLLLALTGSKRMLAPLALLIALVAALVIIITGTGLGAGSGHRHLAVAERAHTGPPTTVHTSTRATQTATQTTTTPSSMTTPPTPVSLNLATQLEGQGHDLLQTGQSTQAVPILRRALAATGEDVSACVEPQSTMCLTYAYALYDLGRALRLSGDPAAAVPILERRLQIDNQRPTVLAELELARQGAA